jgi:PAS domain S-box-containing protein
MATTRVSGNSSAADSGRRLARRNHAVRAGAFAYCFLVLALHGWERHLGWGYWVALLSWLVLPHLQYLYAIRARDPRQAEVRNIFADSLTFGIWTGALHFPPWVVYAALSSVLLNAITLRGVMGALVSLVLFLLPALAWALTPDFRLWAPASDLVSMLSFFGALGYTLSAGLVVHRQWRRLMAARDALRSSEERYRLITEHAADLIGVVDQDSRWLYASPSYERVLAEADLEAGADAFRRLHPDDADRARAAVLRAAASGVDQELPVRLSDHSGSTRHYRMRLHRLAAEAGLRARVLLVSQDLTHYRESEAFLRLAAQAVEGLDEAVVIVDADGIIKVVNGAFFAITGYTAADLVGRPDTLLRADEHTPAFYEQIYAAASREGQWAGVVAGRRRNGAVYRARRSVRPVRDPSGATTHYVIAFHEVVLPRGFAGGG